MRAAVVPVTPIIVAEWDRNAREVVRIDLPEFNGPAVVGAGVWYRDGAELKPSRSGITLGLKHLPVLNGRGQRSLMVLALARDGVAMHW